MKKLTKIAITLVILLLSKCAVMAQTGINVNPIMPQWDPSSMLIVNGEMTLWGAPDMTGNTDAVPLVRDAVTGKIGTASLITSGAISVETYTGNFLGVNNIQTTQGSYPAYINDVPLFETFTVDVPANSKGLFYWHLQVAAYSITPNINGSNPDLTGRIGTTVLIDGSPVVSHPFEWKENIPRRTGVSIGNSNYDTYSVKQISGKKLVEFDNTGGAAYSFTVQVMAFIEVQAVNPDANITHIYDWNGDVNQGEAECYVIRIIY